jgi:hypothetical protein
MRPPRVRQRLEPGSGDLVAAVRPSFKPDRTADQQPELLTITEAAEVLRTPVATLRYWRHLGTGPPQLPPRPARPLPARRHPRLDRRAARGRRADRRVSRPAEGPGRGLEPRRGRSATMTLDPYGHLLADQLDEIADAMDAARAEGLARRAAAWVRALAEVRHADPASCATSPEPLRCPRPAGFGVLQKNCRLAPASGAG